MALQSKKVVHETFEDGDIRIISSNSEDNHVVTIDLRSRWHSDKNKLVTVHINEGDLLSIKSVVDAALGIYTREEG